MHGTMPPTQWRDWIGQAGTWLAAPAGRRLAAALAIAFAGQIFFAAYEAFWLDLPIVREEPASFAAYQLVQSGFIAVVAALTIGALLDARAPGCGIDGESCRRPVLAWGLAALLAAVAAILLFLLDPLAFHDSAQEDRPIEWLSALMLFAAGAALRFPAVRRRRQRLVAASALALGLLLLLIGAEEISWGQRLFGFATPDQLAAVNWQEEFNFHNVQTDLSETLYYVGASVFLLLLPLLRDVLPSAPVKQGRFALLPKRGVALLSAPVVLFNYGHWNLYAIQLVTLLTVLALLAWGRAAHRRGDRAEAMSFLAGALTVVTGQTLLLAFGSAMLDLPDATEYKEFFIALGFAGYAAMVARPAASAG
ncbi:MAG: hypothetical protein ACXWUN_02295 [Allosphingosinicella sp.]